VGGMTAEGIVRPARRPPGWVAPGPRPMGRDDLGPFAGEDLCYLAGEWRIFQRVDGHRWSLDDLVTAWVAAAVTADRPPARFVDLGCGIGTVLMLLAWKFPDARGVGVEAQAASVDLARRSLAWNGAAPRCEVRHGDFRDGAALSAGGAFDLVTGTPPYLTPGHATASHRAQCGPCHFEERGGVEAYCARAATLLAPDARFVMCAAAFQDARVRAGVAAAGLTVEHDLVVVPREGKAPLFAVYVMGRHAAGDAVVASARELVVRDRAGQWTPEFRALRASMGMPPHAAIGMSPRAAIGMPAGG
jgi:tRNA1Val (adenine37-N6)-methyltransferase